MYQHQDYIESFDLGLLAPEVAGMTAGSNDNEASSLQEQLETVGFMGSGSIDPNLMLEKMMQFDKQATLSSLQQKQQRHDDDSLFAFGQPDSEWLESSSSLRDLMELAEVEEVKEEVVQDEDPEALIEEMEQFLGQFDTSASEDESKITQDLSFLQDDPEACPLSSTLISDADKLAAEQIIDELFYETIALEDADAQEALHEVETTQPEIKMEDTTGNDSGFSGSILSTAEMIMSDGTKVIFVVTNDLDEANPSVTAEASADDEDELMSPAASARFGDDEEDLSSDASWSPAPSTSRSSRTSKTSERKSSSRRPRLAGVDKKERKKIQNVEAARRYRDKKKSEQQLLDEELDQLVVKNKSLRSKAAEKEAELKTLKKLMLELGIIKAKKLKH